MGRLSLPKVGRMHSLITGGGGFFADMGQGFLHRPPRALRQLNKVAAAKEFYRDVAAAGALPKDTYNMDEFVLLAVGNDAQVDVALPGGEGAGASAREKAGSHLQHSNCC